MERHLIRGGPNRKIGKNDDAVTHFNRQRKQRGHGVAPQLEKMIVLAHTKSAPRPMTFLKSAVAGKIHRLYRHGADGRKSIRAKLADQTRALAKNFA